MLRWRIYHKGSIPVLYLLTVLVAVTKRLPIENIKKISKNKKKYVDKLSKMLYNSIVVNLTAYHSGSVVKRLRHRPFTAVTRVRFPSESLFGPLAQLVRATGS